jgi:hypothetical protein
MAHITGWYDEDKTIVHQNFYDQAGVTDYLESISISVDIMSQVSHTVHILMDLQDAQVNDRGLLSALTKAGKIVPPNQGCVVIIGGKTYHRVLADVAKVIAPKAVENVYFTDTLEQAMEIINKQTTPVR